MSKTPHPQNFLIAHRLFIGASFRAPVWANVTDGPADLDEVLCLIEESFARDNTPYSLPMTPSLDTLRVWRFQDDVAARDVTEDVLAMLADRMEVAA